MTLFVLAETPAGYGLFQSSDKKLLKREQLSDDIVNQLSLKKFVKFDSAANALEEAAALKEGKVPSMLSRLLDDIKEERKAALAVADKSLGTAISKLLADFDVTTISDSSTMEVFRSVREHFDKLIPGLSVENMDRMALGLSHSMSRHKLRFSADKVDAMVVQAIKLLDDMDKELNVYAMRTKEWYGWHFPELAKILNDNIVYCRLVVAVGMRDNFAEADLAEILPEELIDPIKAAAEISMGTEMAEDDLQNIQHLAQQVITYTDFRAQLSSYLESRMRAIAPNLTALLGYLVGSRLLAHSGSLLSLSKSPASTIQILGAEKALFRALKTKHDTPKYGLLYNASLVGQATGRNKGKIARMLGAKTALGIRIDAYTEYPEGQEPTEEERSEFGIRNRIRLENRLRKMEGKPLLPKGVNVGPDGQLITPAQFTLKEIRKYNLDADGVTNTDAIAESGAPTKRGKKALIEVVDEEMQDGSDEDQDEAMDVDDDSPLPKNGFKAKSHSAEDEGDDDAAARKAQKAEKKARKEEKAARKEEKRARKEAKKSRRAPREVEEESEQGAEPSAVVAPSKKTALTPEVKKISEADYERLASEAGISVSKFKRKFERGDVAIGDDGSPRVYGKKELKELQRVAAVEAQEVADSGGKKKKDKKRKHEADNEVADKKEKQHKKKRSSAE